eukprot:CAMPEP_0172471572 /NCGR_PEP_ID=MMETSP1065-20121228/67884_1 /TAXON_ID=265537 /ORGANISM="Amphiprora paludosa, Strain CCMP125" /LENGTH=792 /DNA_ID=CAMNT_0013229675 /DNA_START=1096 /DNA_END=3474 /DNA_ORIENTATION=-
MTSTTNNNNDATEEKMDDSSFWQPSRRNGNGNSADQSAMYSQLLRELSLFVTEKEDAYNNEQVPLKKKTKLEVSADAERLLRDAVAAFSDSRPPTNFVVYEDTSEEGDMNNNNNNNYDTSAMEGPPIFDGSVANATPQTGGAGTILHLACALDEPLCLAFGLAMGADARACHTAFRRLMIHEAACNGSIQCLTLLLELGRQYGSSTLQDNDADAKLPPRLSRHARTFELPFLPRRLDRSEILAPLHMYASGRGTATSTTAPAPLQTQRMSAEPPAAAAESASASPASTPNRLSVRLGKKNKQPPTNGKDGSNNGTDFLTLLQRFRFLARQVKKGEMSELDAARKVLELSSLSDSSKMSLARSCAFDQQSQTQQPELSLRTRSRQQGGTSDGHGNTPLHWAAFKNETECVSLLLSYGANPNARAHPSGWTPLHDAAYSNSKEAVQLLIDAGAHVDARANSGATPLCFAAQEDASKAADLLLARGADLSARCAGGPLRGDASAASRFSGYTPLHYCAHYNAQKAAHVLLSYPAAQVAMEIPDLNDRLPIHVAVARGSSAVLQELLHAGARVVTRVADQDAETASTTTASSHSLAASPPTNTAVATMMDPSTPRRVSRSSSNSSSGGGLVVVSTPVSSPVLRSMIPSQPVTSSKPWNCLTQQAIDECRELIHQAELHWSPERNHLFTPSDRKSVMAILMTGKRLEQSDALFLDLWPQVLSYCGRGWFDPVDPSQAPTVILPDPATSTATTPLASPTGSTAVFYNTSQPPVNVTPQDPPTAEDETLIDDSLTLPNL